MTQALNFSITGSNANTSGVLQTPGGGTNTATPGAAGNVLTSNGTNWVSQAAGGVTSFNTRTGAVTLTSSDVTTALGSTPVTSATNISNTGGWSVTPSGTKLFFNFNGTNVGSLDSSGNFIVSGNVTAFGTP